MSARSRGEGALGQPGAINHGVRKQPCFSPEERSPAVATAETLWGGGGLRVPVPPSHHRMSPHAGGRASEQAPDVPCYPC